jgi:hypothetical protein
MVIFPELGAVPPEHQAEVSSPVRYEDVTEDGRVLLTALPHHMGLAVFQTLLVKSAAARAHAHLGIVPILSRLVIESGGGPISVRKPVTAAGAFQLAHTVDEAGATSRLLLEMWATVTGPAGRTHGPAPADAGAPVAIGRVFGEHVFTRLFAPPGERKVLRFPPGPWPEVPEPRRAWRPPEALLELPAGAAWLEERLTPDDAPVVFGLAHTDSNHHVNSLVYPRLFEEAALRRLAALGRPTRLLGRAVEVAYRKPSFAGQKARIVLRAFERGATVGAVGVFVPGDDEAARPLTTVCLELG